jgi:signal recognition particle receptor subunit beta
MGEGHLNGEHVRVHSTPLSAPSAAAAEQIGAPLARARQQSIACGKSLATLVEPAGRALVHEALDRLQQQALRIAIVGQIKSGKSTLINAFVRQPRLLPTDVTPWTTTVTHMHFGKSAPQPGVAAKFEFFSSAEWNDLANGDRRIRELTRHLDPAFESDLLRQHIEAMKQRSVMRLGNDFSGLLGSSHSYASFDTGLLSRYVCSGIYSERSNVGQYADITKQAHLYFDRGPFAFPATLTDTPGTNDPSLVRDEITRRSLDQADLYIVVVTARQPLSTADVNLMRLMRGLNSDRIIVFVNRIDDFSDVGYDLAEVLMYVERKLNSEFPGAKIPVIAGSAAWANAALLGDADTLARVQQRPSIRYLELLGLMSRTEFEQTDGSDGGRQRLARALHLASGLPSLYRAVGEYMRVSPAARLQMQTARWFGEMARATSKAASVELESLQRPGAMGGNDRTSLEREMGVLGEVASNVSRSSQAIQQQYVTIIGEEMSDLRQSLTAVIEGHAMNERHVLVSTLKSGGAPSTWTLEGVALRRALAEEFKACFDRATDRVLALQMKVAPELARLMRVIAPEIPLPAEPEKRLLLVPSPSMAALSRFVALDIDDTWWSSLWKGRTSPETYGTQIEALIRSEFQSVADELVATAERALTNYATMSVKWSFGLCANIVQAVTRRREQLMAQINASGRGMPQHVDPQQLSVLSDRVRHLNVITHQLEAVYTEAGATPSSQTEAQL